MEKVIIKGEKVVISKLKDPSQQLVFELSYPRSHQFIYDLDIFGFMMDENGVISKNAIIFYNNPSLDQDAVNYNERYESEKISKSLEINLTKLPKDVHMISLALSVYCKNRSNNKEPLYVNFELKAINKTQRNTMFISIDKLDFVNYQSFILGEIYKYRDTWKYNAIKQEMDEGLMDVTGKMYQMKIY